MGEVVAIVLPGVVLLAFAAIVGRWALRPMFAMRGNPALGGARWRGVVVVTMVVIAALPSFWIAHVDYQRIHDYAPAIESGTMPAVTGLDLGRAGVESLPVAFVAGVTVLAMLVVDALVRRRALGAVGPNGAHDVEARKLLTRAVVVDVVALVLLLGASALYFMAALITTVTS